MTEKIFLLLMLKLVQKNTGSNKQVCNHAYSIVLLFACCVYIKKLILEGSHFQEVIG